MMAKRLSKESSSDDQDQPSEKRIRTRPSFASVIGEVVMVNSLQNLCSAMEPLLRRVVKEEMEISLRKSLRSFNRSPSLRIQALEPSSLRLIFSRKLSLPIFTGSKIVDVESAPLQILLVDTRGEQIMPANLPHPIKIDVVVLDGDFPLGDREIWTSEEFENNIVKERTGKRPLLTGELSVTVRDGFATIGDIEFTDNSSWIRSRKFRIGAKVAAGSNQGVRIREAMTEAFIVKDHRGELYKKHHPPSLEDEVWRLEKIGKDGAFHKKLASEGINTVQDFLKLSTVDPTRLRRILGAGMSEKMWEVTIKHARTCTMSNRRYIFRGHNFTVILNPVCQIVEAVINGRVYPARDLACINRGCIENLVREAHANWYSLEEVEGHSNETALLLTQGDQVDQYPNQQTMGYLPSTSHPGCDDWQVN